MQQQPRTINTTSVPEQVFDENYFEEDFMDVEDSFVADYMPAKLKIGGDHAHPSSVVESSTLADDSL